MRHENIIRRWCRSWAAALAVALCVPVALQAAETGLLRLVGADAGVVVEVSDLQSRLPRLKECEVLRRLEATALYQTWKSSDDFRKLSLARTVAEQLLGQPVETFVNDVFGRSVVLAVYPDGETETRAVLISQAASNAALDAAIDAWNRADRSELARLTFAGREYVRRTRAERHGKPLPAQFYVRLDNVIAFSECEPAIRRLIALDVAGANASADVPAEAAEISGRPFLSLPANRTARGELPPRRLLSLYLNPRAWDSRVKFNDDKPAEARWLKSVWQRCDSIACGLYVNEAGLSVETLIHFDDAAGRPVASDGNDAALPAFLQRVPRDAVALFAGRHDLAAAARFLLARIPDEQRAEWDRGRQLIRGLLVGLDLFDDVLPALGRNWGAYLLASNKESAARTPLEAAVGVELPPAGEVRKGNTTLRDGLDNALQTALRLGLTLAPAETGGEAPLVQTAEERGNRLRWIDNAQTVQPAYVLAGDYLAAGTSLAAVRQFVRLAPGESLAADPLFRETARQYFPAHSHLIYVNSAALRAVVSQHRPLIAERLAGLKALDGDQSQQRVRLLEDLLQSFDAAFVAGHVDTRRIRVTAGFAARTGSGR